MTHLRAFKQKLSAVNRLWADQDYDQALAEVESLLKAWPGNGHLHILFASLVQLQEDPKHSLDEAKQALRQAIDLDKSSPAGPIELGHFLDTVEDNPQAASKSYAEGVAAARQRLIEGLMGQAKVFLQLERTEDCLQSLLEVLHLLYFEPASKRNKLDGATKDITFESPAGQVYSVQLKGAFAEQIEEILNDLTASTRLTPGRGR